MSHGEQRERDVTTDNGQAEPPVESPLNDDVEDTVEPGSDAGPVLAPYHKDAMPTADPDDGAQL